MPFGGGNDLRALFRQMGLPVSFEGVSTYSDNGEPIKGMLDRPVQMKLGESGIGAAEIDLPELRLPFDAFDTMPRSRDIVTVDGTQYKVDAPTAEDDGAIVCYALRRTS